MKFLSDSRLRLLVAIAVLVPLLSQFIVNTLVGPLHKLELLTYDWHCRSLPVLKPDPRLVLVGMDADSMVRVLPGQTYPVPPRPVLARVVDHLHEAGARVIGFDEMFDADFGPKGHPDPAHLTVDEIFAASLKRQGGVVAAADPTSYIGNGDEQYTFQESAPTLKPYILQATVLADRFFDSVRWFKPYPRDKNTGVRYPDISMALTAMYHGETALPASLRSDYFRWGSIKAPIAQNDSVLIRYIGGPGTFQPIPYYKIYFDDWKKELGPNFFRGKIVLIGIIDPHADRQDTPWGEMQGVEILMNRLQTVLRGDWIREWGTRNEYLWALAMGAVLIFAVWKVELRWVAPMIWLFLMALVVLTSHYMFLIDRVWAPTVEPLLSISLTYISATIVEGLRIRRVLHRFLPSQVADQWLRESDKAAGSTEEVEATIAFCDVRNYTKMSESLPPENIDELLQRYFNAGEDLAIRHGTELDKFVGDEIMLYFIERDGGPKKGQESHALRAVRWAIEMQREMEKISATGLAGDIGFRIGIGLCSGRVRFGTVGARRRIQHTVIGDAVNTASRLQGVTKEVNRGIVMGESTYLLVADRIKAEQVGEVSVKGKAEPLPIYSPE